MTSEKLGDYILRLKTTSIHTVKYAETLNILLELVRYEQETAERTKNFDMLLNPQSIMAQLKDSKNYSFVLKAV